MLIICRAPRVVPRKTRLSIFIRDAAGRSVWGCPVALLLFAIDSANAELVGRFS
jgi:hypothetical protein